MERECFEDEEVAALLNQGFVSIKVDREERPDIDSVYMNVCQAMTGSGGWPLTVFLTPEGHPFFAGTYFPKHSRYGRIGLVELLKTIREKWEENREQLQGLGMEIMGSIAAQMNESYPGEPSPELLHGAYRSLEKSFDSVYGGFGGAPKFPTPHHLLFLLRYWKRFQKPRALEMVEKTLLAMYCGGIFDHIGFGFARYSTDRRWLVPHFEKMLYDNALLSLAYLEVYQATGKAFYAGVARDIFTYILRDMTSPEGGFYTAEDADSEGVEGKFYLWTPDEVKEVLGDADGEYFCGLYDITEKGNFEGKNILNLLYKMHDISLDGVMGPEAGERGIYLRDERVDALRNKLFAAREKRIHPFKDDKVLTSWNGLMIAALARGAWILGEQGYAEAAAKAAHFLLEKLRRDDGRLLARYRDGEAAYPAYLDDYAFLAWGLLELYQATFHVEYLEEAVRLTREMYALFWDHKNGGFYFSADDQGEGLGVRGKEIADLAIPSGNSVAAWNLLHLSRLTGAEDFNDLSYRQLRSFAGAAGRAPHSCTFYLCALDYYLGPAQEIVVAGRMDDQETQKLLDVLRSAYLPQATVILYQEGNEGERIAALAPHAADKKPVGGRAAVYICENYSCRQPVTSPQELERKIGLRTTQQTPVD
ncbi:MAG TPA: thioredoxin domain-containing protein [Syntrophaceticus sp.]|nr:thioredoxin domain-containing protein [Syntrophaceticus sp.]